MILFLYDLLRGVKVRLPLLLIPLPFLYLLPLWTNAETVKGTWNSMLISMFYVTFAYLLLRLNQKNLRLAVTGFHWTITIFTYFILANIVEVPHFVMSLSKDVSGLGERLGGFLQYPNAFASLLAASLLYQLMYSLKEDNTKGYLRQILITPALVSLLLLTESRGAWLCFSVAWILSIYFVKVQVRYIVLSGWVFASGLLVYILMTINGSIQVSIFSIGIMVLASVALVLMKPGKLEGVKFFEKTYALPSIILILSVFTILDIYFKGLFYSVLPESLQHRLSFGTGTISDRFYYWKDAWSHLSDYWLTGVGGEGWKYYMYQVQSFPYLTSELHNGLFNIFLELGIIGVIYITFLLFTLGKKLIKEKSILLPSFVLILLHSLIDFSLSFPVLILWLLLVFAAQSDLLVVEREIPKGWNIALRSISVVLLIVSTALPIKFLQAERFFDTAVNSSSAEEARINIRLAIEKDPWNTAYILYAADKELMPLNEIQHYLEKGLIFEPKNSLMQMFLGECFERQGEMQLAEEYYLQALNHDMFDISKYEKLSQFYIHEAKRAFHASNLEGAEGYKEKAINLFQEAERLELFIESQSSGLQNQRQFSVSEEYRNLMSMSDFFNK